MIKLFILITLFATFLNSQSLEIWNEIQVGKTHAIKSKKGESLLNNDYIYKWTAPMNHPDPSIEFENNPKYEINGNSYLFTPNSPGTYIIKLDITDIDHNILFRENYFYNVIGTKKTNSIISSTKTETINDNKESVKEEKEEKIYSQNDNIDKRFTIQVAVWQTIEKAIEDKEYLKSIGYDAYIEEKKQENNVIIYRVRVGSFSNKELAKSTRDSLLKKESIRWGKELWIANTK